MNLFDHIGRFIIMLRSVFTKPEKWKVFRKRFFNEVDYIVINSIPLVAFLSVFMGAVISLQTASNMSSPLLPEYTIGYITRQSTILEFSPTIISLIIAGKVGSNIASEIGTMRVTEQIDALEIMGVNSIGYLMLPKILATMIFFPFVVIVSMTLSLIGGWIAGVQSGLYTTETYVLGIQAFWYEDADGLYYALTKTIVFAFLLTAIPSYYGYYTRGGALEVGRSSTKAVVASSVAILLANYVLTQLILI
ncbi:MAG: ABC transporter permease [Crocinitomicaceae bacterium]|nr:ABC transporter permease [Crocinitomicaceae bacterium]